MDVIPLFDAFAGFGACKPAERQAVSAAEWLDEMARLSIGRALVRTAAEDLDSDFVASNEALFAACEGNAALVPCPVAVPDSGYEAFPDDQRPEALLARGAGAVCLRPQQDCWSLSDWASGAFLASLAERRVPVFCRQEQVSLEQAAELARRHRELPVIIAAVGYRSQRVVLPLMRSFPNVHFCLGGAASLHRGVEQLVAAAGAERILFGTGFPESAPAAAITQLTYAEITDEQKALIGSGNLDRLLGGIRR
jgi:predicted TIM-barrel fold metal-dependent hydrolase